MARLVRLTMSSPLRIDASALPASGKPISICTCGLSAKFPYCDGSHRLARQEVPGMLYHYAADGQSVLRSEPDPQAQTEQADGGDEIASSSHNPTPSGS